MSDIESAEWNIIYESDELTSPVSIQIPSAEGITTDNIFSVSINDKGDYYGNNPNSYSDQSEYRFIISSNSLNSEIDLGINLVGSPLIPSSPLFEDNFCPNYGIDGICLSFNESGESVFGSNIIIGEGYYLINLYDEQFTLNGDLVSDYTISLDQGWNLISNPVVSNFRLDSLQVSYSESNYFWADAIELGTLISPIAIGYNNLESSHSANNIIEPFQGYWVHTPNEDVEIIFNSHIYDDDYSSGYGLDNYDWTMKISASEKNPSNPAFSISDFIIIGTDQDADEEFKYGEDIYDIPAVLNYKYTNLYINHSSDWFASNLIDENGIYIESPRFITDIRTPMDIDSFKEWNINGELLGPINSSDSLKIEWEMDEVAGIYPINLLIGDRVINMRQESYIYITGEEFNQFIVQMGEETLDNDSSIISDFKITDLYPNPFNPITQLSLNIPVSDYVKVNIYDLKGSLVNILYDSYMPAGQHTLNWNASEISSGIYLFKVSYQDNIAIKKAILIK